LADYLSDRPDELFNLLADSQRLQFVVLFNKLVPYKDRAIALALGELDTHPSQKATDREREVLAKRHANAAVALLRLGAPQAVWPLLRRTPDPTTRSYIIDRMANVGVDPEILWNRLTVESDASAKAALILSLGHYPPDLLALKDPATRRSMMLDVYRNDVDPGVHGAAAWLLRHGNAQDEMKRCDESLSIGKAEDGRRWYITHQGHTMTLIMGPVEFLMGTPPTEKSDWSGEIQHRVTINRSFAIGTTEITGEQYRQYQPEVPPVGGSERPTTDCPITYATWYDGAKYCRWLSEREKIPESEMCYPPIEQIRPGMIIPANYLERSGYRLPTEAEWEYACRSGSTTVRFFGLSSELLPRYAWYVRNSNEQAWPVGSLMPNDLGLFDVYGNVVEWCQDTFADDYDKSPGKNDLDRNVDVSHERLQKGGAFTQISSGIRSAARSWTAPDITSSRTGFRIARTIR
jgi:formylglycine-generating enzyme required for sulfatase activity